MSNEKFPYFLSKIQWALFDSLKFDKCVAIQQFDEMEFYSIIHSIKSIFPYVTRFHQHVKI